MALTILVQFVFRLSFGLALAMMITPSRLVTSGFYRVHLWVLLGLSTLAALAALVQRNAETTSFTANGILIAAIVAAVVSYLGAVLWLYERAMAGKIALGVVTVATLVGAMFDTPWGKYDSAIGNSLAGLDVVSGGLLLGATMAAMLLGHWYLNTPTMQLKPLQRLVMLMGVAVLFRAVVSGTGLALEASHHALDTSTWLFIAMHWLSGIVGTAAVTWMTWQTLKIPNTQSATGILYVGVICTFLGELTSQLLSVESVFPL